MGNAPLSSRTGLGDPGEGGRIQTRPSNQNTVHMGNSKEFGSVRRVYASPVKDRDPLTSRAPESLKKASA